MKVFFTILSFVVSLSVAAQTPQQHGHPKHPIFLKCMVGRSSTLYQGGKNKTDDQGERSIEIKVGVKSIYVMGYEGTYINVALPIGHERPNKHIKLKVTKHSYSIGSRFINLDTTFVQKFTFSAENESHLMTTDIKIVIDRNSGKYSNAETIVNEGSPPWRMFNSEIGFCESFNPNNKKF